MSAPRIDIVNELDGGPIGLHIRGHAISDEDAITYAWSEVITEEISTRWDRGCDVTFEQPRRVWVRKIPQDDGWMAYSYQTFPQRGASPVILIDFASRWRYRCDVPGCENHYVKGGATTGIPVERIIDPPAGRQDERYVYMCRRHAKSFTAREDAAMRERMAAYYAERDAANRESS